MTRAPRPPRPPRPPRTHRSRRTTPRAPAAAESRARATGAATGPAWRRGVVPAIAVAIAIVVAGFVLVTRVLRTRQAPSEAVPGETLARRANDAVRARDWARAIVYGQQLVRRAPGDAALRLALGSAFQNRAFDADPVTGRSPVRTSLERWDYVQRAIACFDSARACATSDVERAEALYRRASAYNIAGLHAEALDQYRQVLAIDPRHAMSRIRIAAIEARMRNPAYRDTMSTASAALGSRP